jgi:outer membrane protein assembly factor BamD
MTLSAGGIHGRFMAGELMSRAGAIVALAVAAGSLGACSWFGSKDENASYTEQPVDVLYNRALDDLGEQDYKHAAKEFEEVDRQHPYSVWATKAEVMAAFTYYESNKYDDAIIALDRFIQLHPGHKDIPYAYYLKALCYYEQISDVGRDQAITQKALDALAEVAKRFPDTPYARDARLKVELAIDHLAGKEMDIGRYYQKNQQYIGAINRYRVVIERYQTTTHVPEALHRLVECYLALGVKSEAKEAAAVLGYNFPGSDWYADSYFLMTGEDYRFDSSKK